LLYAIIAVRTLAGGLDRTISWKLIDIIFKDHPHYTRTNFKGRWGQMSRLHANTVNVLQTDFEDAYLVAYEKGEVPVFNLEDTKYYDWKSVIDWALKKVQINKSSPVLPAERWRITSLVVHPRSEVAEREELLKTSSTILRRTAILHSLSFSEKLKGSVDNITTRQDEYLLARSWARASVAGKTRVLKGSDADVKLHTLNSNVLGQAIKSLLSEKIIMKAKKRDYRITEVYARTLKKHPLVQDNLRDAVAFKQKLDEVFASPAPVLRLDPIATNGQIMCLTELVAHGRVRVIHKLPPVNSKVGDPWPRLSVWGYTEGTYQAKKVDKNHYVWPVEIVPTDKYIPGLPLETSVEETPVPLYPGADPRDRRRIPYWVDFDGSFITSKWKSLLLAVIQEISFRAGITLEGLRQQLKGLFEEWELGLMLEWLMEVGAAKPVLGARKGGLSNRTGLMACEFWWSIFVDEMEIWDLQALLQQRPE
jgi:hypothetical protein